MSPLIHHKGKIAQAFNRAAYSYDKSADLQKQVGHQLISMLGNTINQADYLLDVGAGTGRLAPDLSQLFPRCQLINLDLAQSMLTQALDYSAQSVCADFDSLPFCHEFFDVIFSNMALQWSADLSLSFSELHRCLKGGGVIAFALPVEGTLKELSLAYHAAGMPNQINQFYSKGEVESALSYTGFHLQKVFVGDFMLYYDSIWSLFKFFKKTGAYSKTAKTSRLMSKSQLNLLNACYLKGACELAATFKVAFFIAGKA